MKTFVYRITKIDLEDQSTGKNIDGYFHGEESRQGILDMLKRAGEKLTPSKTYVNINKVGDVFVSVGTATYETGKHLYSIKPVANGNEYWVKHYNANPMNGANEKT